MRVRSVQACVAFVVVLGAGTALAGFAGTDVFLPSVGAKPGVAPAVWYTTVWVHNPDTAAANVTFHLLERQANLSPRTYTDTVPAGATTRYDNAVKSMFGVETFGAIRVTSNVKVNVGSRIYSQSGTLDDSVGQYFAGVPASFAIGAGGSTDLFGVWQTKPNAESTFRYNFGFVETTGSGTCTVEVRVKDHTGSVQASKTYTVRQWEQVQKQVKDEFPGVDTSNARLTVAVTGGSGRIIAFGSQVAQGSQDPSTFEMEFSDSLLDSGSGGGDITGVIAGAGLTGGGTSGNVTLSIGSRAIQAGMIGESQVGAPEIQDGAVRSAEIADGTVGAVDIADRAVTAAKLSATGGTNGQVLKLSGGALAWAGDDGLTLPYSASPTLSATAFSIHNAGTGGAIAADAATGPAIMAHSSSGPALNASSGPSDIPAATSASVLGHANSGVAVLGWCKSGTGAYGISRTGYGVIGESISSTAIIGQSQSGRGVHGNSLTADGVFGESWKAAANGVFGLAHNADGNGVYGQANAGTGAWGVFGESTKGHGVHGMTSTGVAIYGEASSGVAGKFLGTVQASAPTTGNLVELTNTYTSGGRALYAESSGTTIWGKSTSTSVSSKALAGTAAAGFGVYGESTSGYAGYFNGKTHVQGAFTATSKAFKIDHPLEPDTKYLYHVSVESPDMKNLYDGVVELDGAGEAWVELPAWFEALNRDFRYQLTCIGAFAPVYVANEVAANRFRIAGGRPGMKVSWAVTGIRRDPWANAHRLPVEEVKPDAERGTYLNPELYGIPGPTGDDEAQSDVP